MSELTQLQAQAIIDTNKELITKLKKNLHITQQDIYRLVSENEKLEKQIKQIETDKFDAEFAKKMINRGYEFIGKADGKNDKNIYAECHKNHLHLFRTNTGIGSVVIGICPVCENEINFTNYEDW